MATFTKKEYGDYKNQYILGCASGDFPQLAKVDSLRSLGGTYAKSDFDLDMLKVDIKTKHFKKRLSKKKARALLAELKSIEPAAKSDYAKNMLSGLQEYVGCCEALSKRKTIIGFVCGVMCAVLLCCAVGGIVWMDKTGMLYGTNSIRFTADGQEYTQYDVVKYNNYVQLSSMPTKKGYDATGIRDTKTNTMMFDATGKSLSTVSKKDLSDYANCALEVTYEPHEYSAKIMTAKSVALASVTYTVEDDPEDIFDEPQHLDGYVFDGWFTDSKYKKPFSGNFMDYTDVNQPLVLYPHYSLDGWSLTWELNGGAFRADVPDAYTILSDVRLPDSDMIFREGYELIGWSMNGRLIDYFTPTIMQDTTLCAEWKAISYKITYELNGGILDGNYAEFTVEIEFLLETPIKPGYNFDGWYANKIFTKSVTAIEQGTIGDKMFYAKWTPITYTIGYRLNGGENSLFNPISYTADKDIALRNPQREGYTFDGWLCGNEKVSKLNAVENGNVELSALWLANEYTINVIPNNGNDAYAKIVRYDESYSIEVPQRKGYDFDGYTCEGDTFNRQGVYQLTKDITISASYTPIVYTVSYELNGGENSLLNPSKYTAEKNVVLQNPNREGYTFKGWYLNNRQITELDATEYESAVLAAMWEANEYTITVNPNNGSETYKKTVRYNDYYSIEQPIRRGYTFTGYSFAGEPIDCIGLYTFATDIFVIAGFKANQYTISYVSDSTTVSMQQVTFNEPYALYNPKTKLNHEFVGWFDKEVGGVRVSDGVYQNDGNIVLYASWLKVITYNIESNNDYTIDSTIDKVYLVGNYNGSENFMTNVNVKIASRCYDLMIKLINTGFKAGNDNSAIYAESDGFLLTVEAVGNCKICGGDGSKSTSATVKSNDGKAAIEAARLMLISEQANSFKLQGGNGADGCCGTDGAKENTGLVWCNWGWSGSDGGQAGNSGAAICAITYTDYSNVELFEGGAGTGGTGGSAGYRKGWFAKTWGSDGAKGKDGDVVSVIQYKSEWK